jgi:hypothetical protein
VTRTLSSSAEGGIQQDLSRRSDVTLYAFFFVYLSSPHFFGFLFLLLLPPPPPFLPQACVLRLEGTSGLSTVVHNPTRRQVSDKNHHLL